MIHSEYSPDSKFWLSLDDDWDREMDKSQAALQAGSERAVRRQQGAVARSVAKAFFFVGLASIVIRGFMELSPKAISPYVLRGFLAGGALMPLALIPWGISIAQSRVRAPSNEISFEAFE